MVTEIINMEVLNFKVYALISGDTMLINCTPHDVQLQMENEDIVTIPKSGILTRCETVRSFKDYIDGVPFQSEMFGEVQWFLGDKPFDGDILLEALYTVNKAYNMYFIVSTVVMTAINDSDESCSEIEFMCVRPIDFERDDTGKVLYARALSGY